MCFAPSALIASAPLKLFEAGAAVSFKGAERGDSGPGSELVSGVGST